MVNLPQKPAHKSTNFSGTRSILALILREVSSSNKASGGYIWSIVEPVAGIVLMTIVFSFAFRTPPLGDSFALFYATGMLPFASFRETNNKISKAIGANRQLLAYPKIVLTDPIIARWILIFITQLFIWTLVIATIFILFDPAAHFDFPALFICFVLTSLLGFGFGIFNCIAFMRFPIWEPIWNILNRPLFLISTIFYLYEDMPDLGQDILYFNPLVHVIGFARVGVYPHYSAEFASITYVAFLGLLTAVIGLHWLRQDRSI